MHAGGEEAVGECLRVLAGIVLQLRHEGFGEDLAEVPQRLRSLAAFEGLQRHVVDEPRQPRHRLGGSDRLRTSSQKVDQERADPVGSASNGSSRPPA